MVLGLDLFQSYQSKSIDFFIQELFCLNRLEAPKYLNAFQCGFIFYVDNPRFFLTRDFKAVALI
jgi:hypothetical protein